MLPAKASTNFSILQKFGTGFGHVTADALQMLKVMRSKDKVMA